MNEDDFAKVLLAAAERRASAHGMRLGDGADSDIRRFARAGATRVFAENPGGPPAPVVEDAKAAFEKLIDEMVAAASQIPDYGATHPNVIGEQTLARALSILCPLFPIC